MCGICGVYQIKNGKEAEIKEAVVRMNQNQKKRGPDDDGAHFEKFDKGIIGLGHTRLSILDLTMAGHQPMMYKRQVTRDREQEFWITFNGEIYNFRELRKDLENKSHKFKTQTDTEIILALYAEYGEKAFAMLRGMFAFGLWDSNGNLFLVRDRYGIKPLYRYFNGEKVVFASSVGAIKKSGAISVEKNEKAYQAFLLFGSVPFPMTTLKNVYSVPAGHYLKINTAGQKMVRYYDPLDYFLNKSRDNFEKAVLKTKDLLADSMRLHMISDAPLGIFLSGGLDSSAIAAIAAGQCGIDTEQSGRLKTLSIIFDEEDFSERKYQQLLAKSIKSDHREIKLTKNDLFDSYDEIFEAMDQPTIDGVNTFFIAKAAKEAGIKTVLSGLGSDEIFMGYPFFRKTAGLKKIQKLPEIIKKSVIYFGKNKKPKMEYLGKSGDLNFYLGIRGLFSPSEAANITGTTLQGMNNLISEIWEAQVFNKSGINNLSAPDLVSYMELNFYLQNQLLKDTDFMSMYHSIEVRVPFLDHPLVEYLSGLPAGMKLANGKRQMANRVNKPILAEAARNVVPSEILYRKKMGFTFPFGEWLKQMPDNFAGKALENYHGKFRNGKLHWSRLWALSVFLQR